MAAAALELDGQVESLGPHAGEEPVNGGGRSRRLVVAYPDGWRHGHTAVDRAGPAGEEAGVPAGPQEHQLGLGVGGAQGLESGQADQVVADRVGSQHGQLAHVPDQLHVVAPASGVEEPVGRIPLHPPGGTQTTYREFS